MHRKKRKQTKKHIKRRNTKNREKTYEIHIIAKEYADNSNKNDE